MAKYDDLRPGLRTGDCILFKGNSPLSRAIRLKSEYSHAALVVLLKDEALCDRVGIVEAQPEGLVFRWLGERLKAYDGQAYLFRPRIAPEQQQVVKAFAMDQLGLGKAYDYSGLLGNLLHRVGQEKDSYICSGFVWECWERAGIVPPADRVPTPGDIPAWCSGELIKVDG